MLYLGHAQPVASILRGGVLALHHDQLLSAFAAAGQPPQPRPVSARAGAGAATVSLCGCGIRSDAGARASAAERAAARRSVGGDESPEAGIRPMSAWSPAARARFETDAAVADAGRAGRIWQPRFYDFVVFSERKRVEKLRYMHRNPVKRGLVREPQDWAWSSFRHYACDEAGPVLVNEPEKAELRIRKIS